MLHILTTIFRQEEDFSTMFWQFSANPKFRGSSCHDHDTIADNLVKEHALWSRFPKRTQNSENTFIITDK